MRDVQPRHISDLMFFTQAGVIRGRSADVVSVPANNRATLQTLKSTATGDQVTPAVRKEKMIFRHQGSNLFCTLFRWHKGKQEGSRDGCFATSVARAYA